MLLLEKTAFKFDELDEHIKQQIREQHAESLEYDWWEFSYGDFILICEALHIDIRCTTRAGRNTNIREPHIYFSGFHTQGDGASWAGTVYLDADGDTLTRIQAHAPQDEELHAIAKRLDILTATYRLKLGEFISQVSSYVDITTSSSNYVHSNTMAASTENMIGDIESLFDTEREAEDIAFYDGIEDEVLEIARDLANWLYSGLQNEYEYLQSDEAISELDELYTAEGETT